MFGSYNNYIGRKNELRPVKFPDSFASSSAPQARRSNDGDVVTRRVISAKEHRLRHIQNQLTDAHLHINALTNENRLLRSLQKRMEAALQRYEGSNADIPRLLNSHGEEIRSWQVRHKKLRLSYKELSEKLKNKDAELQKLNDEHKHLLTMTKNNRLGEREELQIEVNDLKNRLEKQNETINLLHRKILLENKSHRYRLQTEVLKRKQIQMQLNDTISNCERLTALLEKRDKIIASNTLRRNFKGAKSKSNEQTFDVKDSFDISKLSLPNEISSYDSQVSFESYAKTENVSESTHTIKKDSSTIRTQKEADTILNTVDKHDSIAGSSKANSGPLDVSADSFETVDTKIRSRELFYENTADEMSTLLELETKLSLERNLVERVIDNYCDDIITNIDDTIRSNRESKKEIPQKEAMATSTSSSEVNNNAKKNNQLDEMKKQKLLAALKAIDLGEDDGLAINALKKENATHKNSYLNNKKKNGKQY